MNLLSKIFIALVASTLPVSTAFGDAAAAEAHALVWEQPEKSIALSVSLITWVDNHRLMSGLEIKIKNSSKATEYYSFSPPDKGIRIFYINVSGNSVPLHDYGRGGGVIQPTQATVRPYPIDSGQVLSVKIDLSDDEFKLLKKNPSFYSFYISAQEAGGYQKIQSSPRLLEVFSVSSPDE